MSKKFGENPASNAGALLGTGANFMDLYAANMQDEKAHKIANVARSVEMTSDVAGESMKKDQAMVKKAIATYYTGGMAGGGMAGASGAAGGAAGGSAGGSMFKTFAADYVKGQFRDGKKPIKKYPDGKGNVDGTVKPTVTPITFTDPNKGPVRPLFNSKEYASNLLKGKQQSYKLPSDARPISKRPDSPKSKQEQVADVLTDTGTGLLNAVGSFGTSMIGDLANTVSPDFADALEKYTAGILSHTSNKQVQENREGWDSRIGQTANTITNVLGAELLGAGMQKLAPYIAKGLNKAEQTALDVIHNTYKINPLAEQLKNPNKSYRVAGYDSYNDFKITGKVRSKNEGPSLEELNKMTIMERFQNIPRPTSFPSFQKGFADTRYLPEEGGVIYETSVPTFKRGEINPVTQKQITGRHYAHRPIDMETGLIIKELPAKDVKVYDGKPHWLQGYKELPKHRDGKKCDSCEKKSSEMLDGDIVKKYRDGKKPMKVGKLNVKKLRGGKC